MIVSKFTSPLLCRLVLNPLSHCFPRASYLTNRWCGCCRALWATNCTFARLCACSSWNYRSASCPVRDISPVISLRQEREQQRQQSMPHLANPATEPIQRCSVVGPLGHLDEEEFEMLDFGAAASEQQPGDDDVGGPGAAASGGKCPDKDVVDGPPDSSLHLLNTGVATGRTERSLTQRFKDKIKRGVKRVK